MRLTADDNRHNYARECECGNPKPSDSEGCARCRFLDGTARWGFVIDALRGTDGLSLRELAEATGHHREALQRTMKKLLDVGRVRRYWREIDSTLTHRGHANFGKRIVEVRSGGDGCWVYALDGDAGLLDVPRGRPNTRSERSGTAA